MILKIENENKILCKNLQSLNISGGKLSGPSIMFSYPTDELATSRNAIKINKWMVNSETFKKPKKSVRLTESLLPPSFINLRIM